MMKLSNCTLYCIFVRNCGGSFRKVAEDLPRLRELGIDLIWLLPIHPIGSVKRKGSLGSPYAIMDYRSVNPEYGSLEDFIFLCDAVHENGMKILIDVVYNHTSPDSVLASEHAEWFYRTLGGDFGNRIGDWTDIIDLDYGHPELWDYQIETLKYWAQYVDGFRCDVAPLVPLDFWKRARREVEEIRPGCIWLAESVDPEFVEWCNSNGIPCLSDSELYETFDICYDYDVYPGFIRCIQGEDPLDAYIRLLNRQEVMYPSPRLKLRFTENHDRERTAALIPDRAARENWIAWMFFQRGIPLLYCGEEWAADHLPGLFDYDPVRREGEPQHKPLLQRLIALKKQPLFGQGTCVSKAVSGDCILSVRTLNGQKAVGVFSMKGRSSSVAVPLRDGSYRNAIDERSVLVENGSLITNGSPVILITDHG